MKKKSKKSLASLAGFAIGGYVIYSLLRGSGSSGSSSPANVEVTKSGIQQVLNTDVGKGIVRADNAFVTVNTASRALANVGAVPRNVSTLISLSTMPTPVSTLAGMSAAIYDPTSRGIVLDTAWKLVKNPFGWLR